MQDLLHRVQRNRIYILVISK
ncbi:MAG: hypothetical protein RL104_1086, partial [Bacteroidota bacterium]